MLKSVLPESLKVNLNALNHLLLDMQSSLKVKVHCAKCKCSAFLKHCLDRQVFVLDMHDSEGMCTPKSMLRPYPGWKLMKICPFTWMREGVIKKLKSEECVFDCFCLVHPRKWMM